MSVYRWAGGRLTRKVTQPQGGEKKGGFFGKGEKEGVGMGTELFDILPPSVASSLPFLFFRFVTNPFYFWLQLPLHHETTTDPPFSNFRVEVEGETKDRPNHNNPFSPKSTAEEESWSVGPTPYPLLFSQAPAFRPGRYSTIISCFQDLLS